MFKTLTDKEKEIPEIQKDISTVLFENKEIQKQNEKIINTSLFDAKSYNEYLDLNNKICNKKYVLNELKMIFVKKNSKNFTNFCLNKINTRCKDLSINIDKNFECDELFYNDIKNEIKIIMKELNLKDNDSDQQNIKKISNILQYLSLKMKENKLYINSNCQEFFKSLETQIIKAKNYIDNNFDNNLKKLFEF